MNHRFKICVLADSLHSLSFVGFLSKKQRRKKNIKTQIKVYKAQLVDVKILRLDLKD